MAVGIVVWLLVVVGAFYLLLWRPQQRRMNAVRALQSRLRAGDEVLTTSGIYGTVVSLDDDRVDLEVAPHVVIRVARGAIGQRLVEETGVGDEHGTEAG